MTLIQQMGQDVVHYTDFDTEDEDPQRLEALKTKDDEGTPYFAFPEQEDISEGDFLQIEGARDLWEVVHVEDVMSAGEFVKFQVFVEKVGSDGSTPSDEEQTHAVIQGPVYGGIQIGGEGNRQDIDVAVDSDIMEATQALADLFSSSDLSSLEKQDAYEALQRLQTLSDYDIEDSEVEERAEERIQRLRDLAQVANLTAAVAPHIGTLVSFFGL